MGNKLKNIFSDEEIALNGKINFKNHDAYKRFIEALETVQEEGKLVQVSGIDSVETSIRNGESLYPLDEHENIIEFFVAPSIEEVSFELETDYGKKLLVLKRYRINKGVVLQTADDAIVFLKLLFETEVAKIKITYHVHPENATSVREVIESYSMVLSFFNRLFRQDVSKSENGPTIDNMKGYFENAIVRYKKLEFVEKEFSIHFTPDVLAQNEESWLELEELYLALEEKKVIRLNAKVNVSETTGMKINQQEEKIKVGETLAITFIEEINYSLWDNNITLYAACLLTNAIVKEINKISNNETKILYGSEDSRPMYISYRGFKTKQEAEDEMQTIMSHKDEYVNALTVLGYINTRG